MILNEILILNFQYITVLSLLLTIKLHPVYLNNSDNVTHSAISVKIISFVFFKKSNTPHYVINLSTTFFPVRGKVHVSNIFYSPLNVWFITTINLFAPFAKSITPPIPFTYKSGANQDAKSPLLET